MKLMKCPFCGFSNVERVREWDMPKMGYHVAHYICRNCGGRFNHYVGRGREFVLRVGFKR
jgi:transcription elongation factor Elf1